MRRPAWIVVLGVAVVCGLAPVPVSAGAPAAKERATAAAAPTRIMCANHAGTRYVSRRKPRT